MHFRAVQNIGTNLRASLRHQKNCRENNKNAGGESSHWLFSFPHLRRNNVQLRFNTFEYDELRIGGGIHDLVT